MLLTARSPEFIHAHHANAPGVPALLHTAAQRTHFPWFTLTYLTCDDGTGTWVTACAQSLEELRKHIRTVRDPQLAHLLVMAPPRWSSTGQWSRFRVDMVERGKHAVGDVLVYTVAGRGEYCFDSPEVDPCEVTHRRRVLHINWYRHFDI